MSYSGLSEFISDLEKHSELLRIGKFVDPILEITEIADRITKNGGKAILFENTGTNFPILINAFGSLKRMSMALSRNDLDEPGLEILTLFEKFSGISGRLSDMLTSLPQLIQISGFMPSHTRRKGICQEFIIRDPDLSLLPVLKCWPFDGGRFITLPMVHTIHPESGKTNVGMYRMQILDKKTTAMHWQLHKTGANHFKAWKKLGKKMPVSVTLGGDPVYTYASTAPLPENIDEYILAGFLRKKKVKLVKCITNDLFIPSDADIVLEGYVDPSEEPVCEGPFGDHTGVYSLNDLYPRFHVTCITHRGNAIYPATIVGIPPMEDAWLTKATEKIFLAPLKITLQPEIEDLHMPDAGVAHNLVIVKINKTYQGQGKKVINSLFGAGQMMFTKYLVVVSGQIDIRNYREIIINVLENTDFRSDILFGSGPLDVLDHASDTFSFGGKLGIDGTIKMKEELFSTHQVISEESLSPYEMNSAIRAIEAAGFSISQLSDLPVLVTGLDLEKDPDEAESLKRILKEFIPVKFKGLILAVDHNVAPDDIFKIAWQILGNTDPLRDIESILQNTLFIDGTIKAFRKKGFPRRWPNVVCSSNDIIKKIDQEWESFGIGPFIPSPSISTSRLCYRGGDMITTDRT